MNDMDYYVNMIVDTCNRFTCETLKESAGYRIMNGLRERLFHSYNHNLSFELISELVASAPIEVNVELTDEQVDKLVDGLFNVASVLIDEMVINSGFPPKAIVSKLKLTLG